MLKNKKGVSAIIIVLIVFVVILTAAVVFLGYKVLTTKENNNVNAEESVTKTASEASNTNVEQSIKQNYITANKYHMDIFNKKALEEESNSGGKIYLSLGKRQLIVHNFITDDEYMTVTASFSDMSNNILMEVSDKTNGVIARNEIDADFEKIDEIQLIPFGSNGFNNAVLFLLMNDGTVQWLDMYEALVSETHKTRKIEGLNDIVRIDYASGTAYIPVAVDVNGKYYNIAEYTDLFKETDSQATAKLKEKFNK